MKHLLCCVVLLPTLAAADSRLEKRDGVWWHIDSDGCNTCSVACVVDDDEVICPPCSIWTLANCWDPSPTVEGKLDEHGELIEETHKPLVTSIIIDPIDQDAPNIGDITWGDRDIDLDAMLSRIAALEARVRELEARPVITWTPGQLGVNGELLNDNVYRGPFPQLEAAQ